MYIYIYIYMYVCKERERERERDGEMFVRYIMLLPDIYHGTLFVLYYVVLDYPRCVIWVNFDEC